MELWAAIDLMGGSAVTLFQGTATRRTTWDESPTRLARRWQDEGADGLHIIDLDAALGIGSNRETAHRIITESRIPVQVGGGVRSGRMAEEWLEGGAARVVVGTLAFSDPAAARELIEAHGAESVVVAADYRDGKIVTKGWKDSQDLAVAAGAKRLEAQGFRHLLTTAVERDGTGLGPDVSTVRELSRVTQMEIMASGGIRDARDILELKRAGAGAAVIGRALYEGTLKLSETKRGLA
jgi:phosphoribosylformimino-5-aminoimidazole carboxamide ribotide isomerase